MVEQIQNETIGPFVANRTMRKPFWVINGKLGEAHFFLERLRSAGELKEARYYFSAFVSAARSVTYAVQVCLKDVASADVWWEEQRKCLKNDPVARYFHQVRNRMIHTGRNPLEIQMSSTMMDRSEILMAGTMMPPFEFLLAGDNPPEREAVKAADRYMALLVAIVGAAYRKHWTVLDLPLDLTLNEFQARRTFEDVEEELGLPRGWFRGIPDETRLYFLKQYSQTNIEYLAQRYPSI